MLVTNKLQFSKKVISFIGRCVCFINPFSPHCFWWKEDNHLPEVLGFSFCYLDETIILGEVKFADTTISICFLL